MRPESGDREDVQRLSTLGVATARGLIRAYELTVRPVLGPSCRFLPSCSEYAREALRVHGLGRGLWLGTLRLCRCHPFHPGGLDEVPDRTPS